MYGATKHVAFRKLEAVVEEYIALVGMNSLNYLVFDICVAYT